MTKPPLINYDEDLLIISTYRSKDGLREMEGRWFWKQDDTMPSRVTLADVVCAFENHWVALYRFDNTEMKVMECLNEEVAEAVIAQNPDFYAGSNVNTLSPVISESDAYCELMEELADPRDDGDAAFEAAREARWAQ